MREWMRTDYVFDLPTAVITLDGRLMPNIEFSFRGEVAGLGTDPATVAAFVTKLIVAHRPELVGGVLMAMRFSVMAMRWEFSYMHPSLPATKLDESCHEMPLMPKPATAVAEA